MSKTMICRDFPLLYSAQLDGYADERDQLALQNHLRECLECRRRAAEMRCLVSDLNTLGESQNCVRNGREMEMTAQFQWALHREARLQVSNARQRADTLDLWRTRILSQGIGAVVSVTLCVLVTLGIFGQIYRALQYHQIGATDMLSDLDSDEIKLKLLLMQPPPPPQFNPSWDLLGIGVRLSEEADFVATVIVHKDGRASVNQTSGTSSDPSVVQKFSDAMIQKASFQPTRPDQNTSAEAVVLFSTVNVPSISKSSEIN
jgi:predicted anti-sigma-YlaC factor YlaD